MKRTLVRLLLAVLLIGTLIGALASCAAPVEYTVKVMDGETVVKEYTLAKDTVIKIPAADIAKTGHDLVALYTDAAMTATLPTDLAITADTVVYAKYTPKTFYLLVDNGLGDEERVNVTYGQPYTLTAPEQEGYRFLNYSYMGETFPLSGTFTYTNSIPVTAKWSKIVYLNVNDGTTVTKYEVAADGSFALPDVADKPDDAFIGYMLGSEPFGTFDAESGKWIGTYTGKTDLFLVLGWENSAETTLELDGGVLPEGTASTVVLDEGTGTLPVPSRDGFTFLGWKNGNNLFSDASGAYTLAAGEKVYSLVASWKSNDTAVGEVAGKNYFKELDESTGEIIYVFLTGTDNFYTFDGYTLTLSANNGVATLNSAADGFVANKPGTFKMTLEAADGSTRTVSCKVETRVTSFESGKTIDSSYAESFKNGIGSVLSAGYQNLIPHLTISGNRNNALTALSLSDIPFRLTIEVHDGTAYAPYTGNGYTVTGDGITITDEALWDKLVKMTFVPSYVLSADKASQTVSFEYRLNDGVNVYTNDELYAAFANNAVTVINVMRDITAVLQPEHTAAGHSASCTCERGDLSKTPNAENLPINDYEHGVYVRNQAANGEQVTINGNYYKLDGSKLPPIDPRTVSSWSSSYSSPDAAPYQMTQVQIGIFTYFGDGHTYSTSPEFTVNDLYIQSNFNGNATEVAGSIGGGKQILKGSMSFHGFTMRDANLTLSNTTLQHTHIGIMVTGEDVIPTPTHLHAVVTLDGAILDNYMANAIYGWGQIGIVLKDSYIGQGSGSALHIDEGPLAASALAHTAYVEIGHDVTIENYVSGTEAWFQAYMMSEAAAGVKSTLANVLKPADLTPLAPARAEHFNFVFLTRMTDMDDFTNAAAGGNADVYGVPYVPVYSVAEDGTKTQINADIMNPAPVPCDNQDVLFYFTEVNLQMGMIVKCYPAQ